MNKNDNNINIFELIIEGGIQQLIEQTQKNKQDDYNWVIDFNNIEKETKNEKKE
jgi:hypothetical protein